MNDFIKNHLKILKTNKFSKPEIELRALLNKSTIINNEILFSNFNINQIDLNLFKSAFKKRLKEEPIAKIFNEKEFWKFNFYVNNHVLDPRPETELIIETVEKYFQDKKEKLDIIDIGTGSGCLAISLAKEFIYAKITATDISEQALKVAKINSKKLNTCNQINFSCCDWVDTNETFDIIVSNPPYLSNYEYENLSREVKFYEPKISLKGGKDGLCCFREIAYKIQNITHANSLCFFEIGYKQKNNCLKIFNDLGLYCVDIIADYQNYDRILVLKNKNY